jgi:hypothetical protein
MAQTQLLEVKERIRREKRPAPVTVDDRWLEAQIAAPWSGMQPVSGPIWESKPEGHAGTIRDTLQRIKEWIGALVPRVQHRMRVFPKLPGIAAVYCPAAVNVSQLAQRFCGGPATDAAPVRPRRPLPPGVFNLAAAVLEPLGLQEGDEQYRDHVGQLDLRFHRPTAEHWAVLWPPQPSNKLLLLTHIDVERDPIVPVLREWIQYGAQEPAPAYPATGVIDYRPTEVIPPALHAMDPDVWPLLRRAGLDRACNKYLDAYHRSQGLTVPAAEPPLDERLRQFRRLTSQCDGELTYRQVSDCLGWHHVAHDVQVVKAITDALMRCPARSTGPIPTSLWYVKRGNAARWRWSTCLAEMRVAAVFVTRLRLGGADVSFLARDIAACVVSVAEKTV